MLLLCTFTLRLRQSLCSLHCITGLFWRREFLGGQLCLHMPRPPGGKHATQPNAHFSDTLSRSVSFVHPFQAPAQAAHVVHACCVIWIRFGSAAYRVWNTVLQSGEQSVSEHVKSPNQWVRLCFVRRRDLCRARRN